MFLLSFLLVFNLNELNSRVFASLLILACFLVPAVLISLLALPLLFFFKGYFSVSLLS